MQIIKAITLALLVLFINNIYAYTLKNAKYETFIESNTLSIIDKLNKNAKSQNISIKPLGEIIQWTSLQLLNSPYVSHLLDQRSPEYLYISLSNTDCMLFIEEVLAVSILIKENKLNLVNYTNSIKKLRYHGQIMYCNRNHYFKDWVIMNRDVIDDVGFSLTGEPLPYKAYILGDMIAQGKNKNSMSLSCIRKREEFIDKETIGFIRLNLLSKYLKYIQSGDIIGVVRSGKNADSIHHLGVAYLHDNKIGMIHASSLSKKVVVENNLIDYLHKFKDTEGIVLIRFNSFIK